MRYVFIINPTAGKGKGEQQLVPVIEEYFKHNSADYKIIITKCPGDAREKAVAEAETGDELIIFSCGGEGTCFEIINGIINYPNVSVGVVPCGSANDFLKYFGDKGAFLNLSDQLSGAAVTIDLIKADEYYCINQCSAGMDAMVADDMSIFKRWPLVSGSMAYKIAVVKTFMRRLGVNITLTIDGVRQSSKRCLFAVCANAPVYGGGYISAPHADPCDGKLDFTVIDLISRVKVPGFLKLYSHGRQETVDYCHTGNCTDMIIEADRPIPVNMDGEIFHKQKVRFQIVRNALKFWLPASLQKSCGRK